MRWQEFLKGVQAELPILFGAFPFGVIYGVLCMQSGRLDQWQAQAMSSIIFAGSAQFITAQLFKDGATALVIILTVFVVNLRHALYSASCAPHFKPLSWRWKMLLAYLLTDEAYAVGIIRYADTADKSPHRHWFFLGSGLVLWIFWQISTALGVFVGTQISETIRSFLEFALPLTFIALVVPNLKDRAGVVAALGGGICILFVNDLPYRSGLLVAAGAGIALGFVVDTLLQQERA